MTLTALLAGALAVLRGRAASTAFAYWAVIALARTAGTCVGDWLAENRLLHLGLPLSTVLTGAAFIALLVVRAPARAPPSVAA